MNLSHNSKNELMKRSTNLNMSKSLKPIDR